MPDHVYDGIRELDNRIPPWFTTLFLGTIVFGAVYLVDYHVFGSSPLMVEEYRQEIAAAELQRRIDHGDRRDDRREHSSSVLTDPEALGRGRRSVQEVLRLLPWLPGAGRGRTRTSPTSTGSTGAASRNVYATIKKGVPAKGMISWQLVFTPKQIQEIASYVLSPAGNKPRRMPRSRKGRCTSSPP